MHIALLGDSILDNRAYTKGEPDIVTHLRQLLPNSVDVTLCAVDGSTTSDLRPQISKTPSSASHIVVSIGGNDALLNSDLSSVSTTKIGPKHQITIPKDVLDALRLDVGDILEAEVESGKIVLAPKQLTEKAPVPKLTPKEQKILLRPHQKIEKIRKDLPPPVGSPKKKRISPPKRD